MSNFFKEKTGEGSGCLSLRDWLFVPEQSLAEATNGKIFRDDVGIFTEIRQKLKYMPDDARLKKLAGHLLVMAQSGQYNYSRCIARGETGAAQLAIFEFVKSAMQVIFLLNKRFMPYYKWSFKAMGELERLSHISVSLEYLISSENTESNSRLKCDMIEDIASLIIEELGSQAITEAICGDLEKHAYSVNDHISDSDIRNKNIFYAI
jgi:hypothetical protein